MKTLLINGQNKATGFLLNKKTRGCGFYIISLMGCAAYSAKRSEDKKVIQSDEIISFRPNMPF